MVGSLTWQWAQSKVTTSTQLSKTWPTTTPPNRDKFSSSRGLFGLAIGSFISDYLTTRSWPSWGDNVDLQLPEQKSKQEKKNPVSLQFQTSIFLPSFILFPPSWQENQHQLLWVQHYATPTHSRPRQHGSAHFTRVSGTLAAAQQSR